MIKLIFFIVLCATTALRLGTLIFLFFTPTTNLPALVYSVTSAVIIYGLLLIFKRLFLSIHLRNYMVFFIVQPIAIIFNKIYFTLASPLRLSSFEMIIVGTFLDILIAAVIVFTCIKQIRKSYAALGGNR